MDGSFRLFNQTCPTKYFSINFFIYIMKNLYVSFMDSKS